MVAGAGNERLAMQADSNQAETDRATGPAEQGEKHKGLGNTRSLKIEPASVHIPPQVRLKGQWLERAGFTPGHRVEVRLDGPGTMTLRFLETPQEPTR